MMTLHKYWTWTFITASTPLCIAENYEYNNYTSLPCAFPFIYKGETYSKCLKDSKDEEAWCPQEVDKNGNPSRWGACSIDCLSTFASKDTLKFGH